MRFLRRMAVPALFPARALLVSTFLLALIWNALGQNSSSSTTTVIPFPPPSSTVYYPPVDPLTPPADVPSTTPGSITCCYVQNACNNCTEVYNVNSIVYCCPNCRGMVLVTDLVCRCTLPKGYQVPDLKCKLSNEVVGGYDALRPSYYDGSGCGVIRAPFALLFLILMATVVL